MKAYQIKVIEDVATEPVTLAEIKARLRIDSDYSANDADLELLGKAAREKLEQYTGLGFAKRKLQVQFSSGVHELPLGPTISANADIVVTDSDDEPIDADKYAIQGLTFKSIALGCLTNVSFFYPENGGMPDIWEGSVTHLDYNVTYETGYEILPSGLKSALLTQIDYDFKAEGSEQLEPISPVAVQKCRGYSRNLVIQ